MKARIANGKVVFIEKEQKLKITRKYVGSVVDFHVEPNVMLRTTQNEYLNLDNEYEMNCSHDRRVYLDEYQKKEN